MNDPKFKVFISLPMRGYTDKEIQDKMHELYNLLDGDFELIDTFICEDSPNPNNRLWFLGQSIQKLGEANFAVFAADWFSAPGCIIERMICNFYEIPIVDERELRVRMILRKD